MSLKIYFCGSISGGRNDVELYATIIDHLKANHGRVLTEHVGRPNVRAEELANPVENLPKNIHDRDLDWLQECDVVVAEVTQPSLGVGYEIGKASALGKPILCLFRPDAGRDLSFMILGAQSGDTFVVENYKPEDVVTKIDSYMTRFK